MKKSFIIFILIIIIFKIYSYNIKLKEKVLIKNNTIKISDIIEETNISELNSINFITIETIDKFPYKIYNNEVTNFLLSHGFYDITITGNSTTVYIDSDKKSSDNKNKTNENLINKFSDNINYHPIIFLENYLNSVFNDKNLNIKIDLIKIEPEINLEDINTDYNWELKKLDYGLKDFEKIKRIPIFINNKKYISTINIKIFSDVLISKKNFLKDDYFDINGFYKNNIDITIFKNIDTIVTDFLNLDKTQFIKNSSLGEILRWSNIKKIPLVKQGELINLTIKRKNLEINIQCTLLEDGFENKKVKVKLNNGNEKFGILKINQGKCYVEI